MILEQWLNRPELTAWWSVLGQEPVISLANLEPAARAYVLAALHRKAGRPFLVVAPSVKIQEEFANDLQAWGLDFLFYPEAEEGRAEVLPDQEIAAERLTVLSRLSSDFAGVVLVTATGLEQKLCSPEQLRQARCEVRTGDVQPREAWLKKLQEAGYARETQVQARGQLSVRGALLDIFPWDASHPFRLEWDDDTIISLRTFDPLGQRSMETHDTVSFLLTTPSEPQRTALLTDYLPAQILRCELEDEIVDTALPFPPLEFFAHDFLHAPRGDFILQEKRRDLFLDHLLDWVTEDWEVVVFCNNEGEEQRLREIIQEAGIDPARLRFVQQPLLRGFVFPASRLVVLSDSEIFGRYQTLRALRRQERLVARRSRQQALDFSEFVEGDAVVHLQYGIALYGGLQKIPTEEGGEQEVLTLEFAERAKLYVPLEQAYLVSKYVGVGKKTPSLDTLGGNRWERAKTAAHKSVMDYAAQLLKVQAERNTLQGQAFAADTAWQKEFEDAFVYEETEDQLTSIEEVKRDMETAKPMDRLICGDVGFGKTEVAIRALFKCVMSGKQAAFLCPTTVLAQQHFENLSERYADYPIRVDLLSRFRSAKQQKETLRRLQEGSVDIVVGTHRLISKDVKFKDLGLVVIDEEQRFGVVQKEKFKQLFRLVDVLTLSATPIPRTLYLSLTGAKDMSTIETPPAHRHPVETIVAQYDERIIREAIERELARNGQVYFLHNRVQSIHNVEERLRLLVPKARIEVGHGQMDEDELEQVMRRFIDGDTDILLSTTIIESGLDIPNANTILIDRADRFGLADLYQLRGRVGRAQHKAYAYLLLPRHLMTVGDARKRVSALKQYSQLGAGFKIAMRDLEIRGAGNLLGTAQSGHIAAVGFELYCQLLKLAVARLKGEKKVRLVECKLQLDFLHWGQTEAPVDKVPAALTTHYMTESRARIEGYRRLAEIQSGEELTELQEEWKDRYGPWPETVELLLRAQELRLLGSERRLQSIETQGEKLILQRGQDFIMVGGKFPRLTALTALTKLEQIKKWVTST
jgi:transcription-repair coupling factor (superfamily II helicase)